MIEKGLVYGRFQILHLKHVEYILAAKMRCKRLYIGITMSDDLHVSGGEEDNYRVRRSANPLTYIERYEMLRDTSLAFCKFIFSMMLRPKGILTPLIPDCYVLCTLAILFN